MISFGATFNLESVLPHFCAVTMLYQSTIIDEKIVNVINQASDASRIKLALERQMTYFTELDVACPSTTARSS